MLASESVPIDVLLPAEMVPPLCNAILPKDPVPEIAAPDATVTVPLPYSDPVTSSIPSLTSVNPLYVFTPVRATVPNPLFVSEPIPLITPMWVPLML